MANLTTAFGFRYKRSMSPSTVPLVVERQVKAATKIYPGDLVAQDTGTLVPCAAAGTYPYGVAIGYGDGDSTLRYEKYVLVIPVDDNPSFVFEARLGNTADIGLDDIGKYLAATIAAGDATLRQSRHALNGATLGTGDISDGIWWKIVGFPDDPQNEIDAAYERILVTIDPGLVIKHAAMTA